MNWAGNYRQLPTCEVLDQCQRDSFSLMPLVGGPRHDLMHLHDVLFLQHVANHGA
jgi:hypothetical protein